MSMSLDGYIAGPDDRDPARSWVGRRRAGCSIWLDDRLAPGINGQVYSEASDTGAVISGRRT